MLKKTLLKNTTRFLETPFPENLFPYKKKNRKRNLLLYSNKRDFLKIQNFSKKLNLMKASLLKLPSKPKKDNKNNLKILFPLSLLKNKLKKVPRKTSDFKKTLKEIKKLSLLYGNLSNIEIKKTLLKAKKLRGNNSDNLLLLLESRLDIILYRSLFFSSIQFARQWIRSNEVLVNSKCVNIPSYKVKPADIISFKPKNKKLIAKNILKNLPFTNLEKAYGTFFKYESKKNIILPWTIVNLNAISLLSTKLKNFKNKIQKLISRDKFTENFALKLNTIIYTHNSFTSKMNFNKLKLNSIFNKTLVLNENLKTIFHNFKFYGFNTISNSKKGNLMKVEKKPHISLNESTKKNYIYHGPSLGLLKSEGKLFPTNTLQVNACTYLEKIFLIKKLKFINTSETSLQLISLAKAKLNPLAGARPCKNVFLNANILTYMNKFVFKKKHRYIISSFYLKQLQNQISPKNDFLLKHSANTTLKKNKKLAVLLIHLDNSVIKYTKNIISLLLDYGDKYFSYQEKNVLKTNVYTLWNFKRYDIFTFLKLKNLFFYPLALCVAKQWGVHPSKKIKESKMSNTGNCKLVFYKPINLEISYKTLSIIYLYPSQKLVFPCTVDVQLLLRHTS